jgi:hypothetical protein
MRLVDNPCAIHDLLLYAGNPNSLAAFDRRTMNFHDAALSGHIDATATLGVPLPATRLLNTLL